MNHEPQSPSDEELVRQCRAGSLDSFEQLVSRHEGAIYRFARSLCRNEADAREVTQDTFVRAFHALEQYQTGRSFSAWLFGIARRKCIDRLRSQRPATNEASVEAVDSNDPATALMREEEAQHIWEMARRELSRFQFEVLWLRFVEDLSVAEIAEATRRTRIHVKVILHRARTRLGAALTRPGQLNRERSSAQSAAGPFKQSGVVLQ